MDANKGLPLSEKAKETLPSAWTCQHINLQWCFNWIEICAEMDFIKLGKKSFENSKYFGSFKRVKVTKRSKSFLFCDTEGKIQWLKGWTNWLQVSLLAARPRTYTHDCLVVHFAAPHHGLVALVWLQQRFETDNYTRIELNTRDNLCK